MATENNSNKFNVPVLPIILGGGAIYLTYLGGSAIGRKLGIVKDQAAQAAVTALTEMPEFDKNYFSKLGPVSVYKFPSNRSPDEIAKAIFDSKGFFKDDKDKFWAAIKRLDYRTKLSQVALSFYTLYQKDLANYVSSMLKEEEIKRLTDYFNSIPSGIVAVSKN